MLEKPCDLHLLLVVEELSQEYQDAVDGLCRSLWIFYNIQQEVAADELRDIVAKVGLILDTLLIFNHFHKALSPFVNEDHRLSNRASLVQIQMHQQHLHMLYKIRKQVEVVTRPDHRTDLIM